VKKLEPRLNSDLIKIEHNFISVFASGISILNLKKEDLDIIKNKSYVITTNFPLSLHEPTFYPNLHIWSDYKVSKFLDNYYLKKEKDCSLLSTPEAFDPKTQMHYSLIQKVDYWFNTNMYKFKYNFTLFSAIMVVRRIYKDKPILVFGLDGFIPDNTPCFNGVPYSKWYDYYIKDDVIDRKFKRDSSNLDRFVKYMENSYKEGDFGEIYNCSPVSRIKYLTKKDFKIILN